MIARVILPLNPFAPRDMDTEKQIRSLAHKALEIEDSDRLSPWCCLFLAGSIRLSVEPLQDQSVLSSGGDKNKRAFKATNVNEPLWAIGAAMVNAVVKGLYPRWRDKAYLVYNALAGKPESVITLEF